MKRTIIGAVVGVVAIGAAVVLFPSPDTGADIQPLAPQPVLVDSIVEASPAVAESPKPVVAMRSAKRDARERVTSRIDAPESKAAAELASPVGGIRYTLRATGEAQALELANALAGPHKDLSNQRRAPDPVAFSDALSAVDTALEDLRSSSYASDPGIQKALERYDTLRADL